jgi:TetR/AcrR family transcriptional regulator, cholesterol catabolism regulator
MARESQPRGSSGKRRDRRAEVMQAAVNLFHEKGYASTSIQDIADRVGVLKGSLYHYIDSKEDLLISIFDESDEQSFALMEEIQSLDIPAVERLRVFARSWSLWYMQNIERASIYVSEWKHLTGERLEAIKQTRHEYEARVEQMIEDVKREGDADADLNTRYACFFVLSAINGLPTWYRRRGAAPAAHIAEVYSDMMVGMVCNTKGRKAPVQTKEKARKAAPSERSGAAHLAGRAPAGAVPSRGRRRP